MILKLTSKWAVGLLAVTACTVLVGGIWWWRINTPLPLPASAEEGLANINSTRYERMPDYRQREYRQAVQQQLSAMPQEERRALMESHPELRESLGQLRREGMDDMIRQFVQASPQEREKMLNEMPMFGPPGSAPGSGGGRGPGAGGNTSGRPRGEGGPRGERPNPETMTAEEREQYETRRAERMREFRERMEENFQSGNPQDMALRMEFFRAMREARQRRQQR